MTDITITVIDREGTAHELLAPTDMGMSLMELCKSYELPVLGTCGGMALCASCQVYVESPQELSAPTDDELDMLDTSPYYEENSRLGCQLKLAEDMDGLVVRLAPE